LSEWNVENFAQAVHLALDADTADSSQPSSI
jgi:hypothetical protein